MGIVISTDRRNILCFVSSQGFANVGQVQGRKSAIASPSAPLAAHSPPS